MRDPDNRILGGVAGGFAAYMDWDPTAVRIVLFLLMFFYGITVPLYFLLWIIVPMARTGDRETRDARAKRDGGEYRKDRDRWIRESQQ